MRSTGATGLPVAVVDKAWTSTLTQQPAPFAPLPLRLQKRGYVFIYGHYGVQTFVGGAAAALAITGQPTSEQRVGQGLPAGSSQRGVTVCILAPQKPTVSLMDKRTRVVRKTVET